MKQRILGLLAVALAMGGAAFAPAQADDYPNKPIHIIIPLAAGGGGDVFTRAIADELQKSLGQPVLVDNRPGGGQNIGARACAEAAPDGYTLCVLSSEPVVYNQYLYKSIPYDPERDFQPIANLFFNTLSVVVNSDLKVKTFDQLVALAKTKPLSYATFSFPMSAFMQRYSKAKGVDIVRVPYRGGGEVVNAVLSGAAPVALLALSNMVSQIQSGRITALAVVSKSRSPLFPDVPTLKEAVNDDAQTTWFGLFTQSATPKPIATRIAAEIERIVKRPDFSKRMLHDRAVEPGSERLDGFAKFIREERSVAEKIVKESGQPPI